MTVPLAMLGAIAFPVASAMDLSIDDQVGLVTPIGVVPPCHGFVKQR